MDGSVKPDGELPFADENALAAAIRKAIGAGPFERVEVVGSPHERRDGKTVTVLPQGAKWLDDLRANAPDWVLKEIGLGLWDYEDGQKHWLFPYEWYDHIPAGYEIVDINGNVEAFEPGVTDNDKRFGCLAYGWRRPPMPPMKAPKAR